MTSDKGSPRPFGRRSNPIETPSTATANSDGNTAGDFATLLADDEGAGKVSHVSTIGATSPLEVVTRMAGAMSAIHSDALALASALRVGARHEGKPPEDLRYWPIRWKHSDKLFEHAGSDGRTLYTTFYFTSDLITYTPLAQYELYVICSFVIATNELAHGLLLFHLDDAKREWLKRNLDAILVKSAYFLEVLKSYQLLLDITDGTVSSTDRGRAVTLQIMAQLQELKRLRGVLFDEQRLLDLLPYARPALIAAACEPYHAGQKVINGVYFKREHADMVTKHITQRRMMDNMPVTRH